jgi:hypothetical protein
MQPNLSRPERMLPLAERALPRATEINRMTMAVITEAACIESNSVNLLRWYAEDPIASLDGRTACQLVMSGHGKLVVRFLRRIRETELQR